MAHSSVMPESDAGTQGNREGAWPPARTTTVTKPIRVDALVQALNAVQSRKVH